MVTSAPARPLLTSLPTTRPNSYPGVIQAADGGPKAQETNNHTEDPFNTVKTASNGDDAPRADGAAAPANQAPPISPTSPGPATAPKGPVSRFQKPVMQSMSSLPDTRQQSFDEIYGPPENFLEIEVCSLPPSPICPGCCPSHAMSCGLAA